ncbi:MAG: methyl-accepting chemotaxis protein [Bacillota bacterium]
MSRMAQRSANMSTSAEKRRKLRFPLGLKLGLGFGTLLAVMTAVAVVVYIQFGQLGEAYSRAMTDQSDAIALSGEIAQRAHERISALRGYVLTGEASSWDEVVRATEAYDAAVDLLEPMVAADPIARQIVEELKIATRQLTLIQDEVRMSRQAGSMDYATQRLKSGAEMVKQVNSGAEAIFVLMVQGSREQAEQILAGSRLTNYILLGVNAAALIFGLLFAFLLTRKLIRPARLVAEAAERLAAGDLSGGEIKITSSDEIGDMARSVSAALQNLRQAMTAVVEAADQVAESAEQLSQTSSDTARGAEEMTQAIGKIAASSLSSTNSAGAAREAMEELQQAIAQIASGAHEQARSVQESADGTHQVMREMEEVESRTRVVASSSQQAAAAATDGGRVVTQAVQAMQQLQLVVQESGEQVKQLGEATGRIGEITQAITEIADQTNLLALNAAIEAARAGEAGRGFAVVAEEVRKLAERSARSALEIGQIIDTIQQGTRRAIQSMSTGNNQVSSTVELTESAGASLELIRQAVAQTDQEVQAITRAVQSVTDSTRKMVESMNAVAAVTEENTASTEEMAAGAEQVVTVFSEMMASAEETSELTVASSSVVEQMTASTEEIAASATQLAETAARLRGMMARFKL